MRTILTLGLFIMLGCSNDRVAFSDTALNCLATTIGQNLVDNLTEADKQLKVQGYINRSSDYLDLLDKAENGEINIRLTNGYKWIYDSTKREDPFMMYMYTESEFLECFKQDADSADNNLILKLHQISRLPTLQAAYLLAIENNLRTFDYDSIKNQSMNLTQEEIDLPITQLTIIYAAWPHINFKD